MTAYTGGVNIGEVVSVLSGLALLLIVFMYFHEPYEGVRKCEDALYSNVQSAYDKNVVVNSMWARTLDAHWVSALVLQPKEIDKKPFTVVCHFKGKSYELDELRHYEGDTIVKLKNISISNLNPKHANLSGIGEAAYVAFLIIFAIAVLLGLLKACNYYLQRYEWWKNYRSLTGWRDTVAGIILTTLAFGAILSIILLMLYFRGDM